MYLTAPEESATSKAAAFPDVADKTAIKGITLRNWIRKAENAQKKADQVSEVDNNPADGWS